MKIGNGWYDNRELPRESGGYLIIAVFHKNNPEEKTNLAVKDGVVVIDTDFYNADHKDWEKNPIGGLDDDSSWEVVAWKPVDSIDLPDEYCNAVPFSKLLSNSLLIKGKD